ncbi:MAG: DUF1697 domain-containing protein [Candidatus Eisenbacteria bacterium]
MALYVGLWRGINVGRAKRIGMADLRAALADAGAGSPRTLLASGNAVFTAAIAPGRLAAAIRAAVARRTGVDARVTLRTAAEFLEALAENPFAGAATPERTLIGFAADAATLARVKALAKQDWHPERLSVTKRAVHLACPNGISAGALAEAVYAAAGDTLTLRNRATAAKLAAMLE